MREHEQLSTNLKNREFHAADCRVRWLIVVCTERLSLKTLEKDYTKTEEDLKAVQSVGQIVAEILKQLDDERCASLDHRPGQYLTLTPMTSSYREGIFWSPLRCFIPPCPTPRQAQDGHKSFARHDNPHHHAYLAERGRPASV